MTPAFMKFADHKDERHVSGKRKFRLKRGQTAMTPAQLTAYRHHLRMQAFRKQKGLCHWCKTPMRSKVSNKPDSVTLEHLIPEWVGGELSEGNIVAACRKCNNERGASTAPPASAAKG